MCSRAGTGCFWFCFLGGCGLGHPPEFPVLKWRLAFAPAGVPGAPDRVLHSPLPFCGRLRGHVLLGRLRTLLYERGLPWCLWRFGGCLVAIGLGTSVGTDCAVNSCGDRMRWYELALKSVCRAYIVVRFGSPHPRAPRFGSHLPGSFFASARCVCPPARYGWCGADAIRGLFTWI